MRSIDPAEEEAFRAVMAHHTLLKSLVYGLIRNPALAEDALSDATLEIVRSWAQYDGTREFFPWAHSIVRRVCRAHRERREREPSFLPDDTLIETADSLQEIGDEAAFEDRKGALNDCLDQMSGDHRRLIEQRYLEMCSYKQLAQLTRKTERALYILFNRLRHNLAVCLAREGLHS